MDAARDRACLEPMRNPWLDIPLADYEGHMASPEVAQAQMIAGALADLLLRRQPSSLAVIGCAGGNGFERIHRLETPRVVGVDINPSYLAEARRRFDGAFDALELICADVGAGIDELAFAPVDLIFAALIFEYADARVVLPRLAARLNAGGLLAVLLQLPALGVPEITRTSHARLAALAPLMRLVEPEMLTDAARVASLAPSGTRRIDLPTGKSFQLLRFVPGPAASAT
jgi:trans-aconitate methyltransferase